MAGLCEVKALWQPAGGGFPRRRPTKMEAEADSAAAAPDAKVGSLSLSRTIVHYFDRVGTFNIIPFHPDGKRDEGRTGKGMKISLYMGYAL